MNDVSLKFDYDLFNDFDIEENKIHKIKSDSKSNQNTKKDLRFLFRDINCLEAIKETGGLPKENEIKSFVSAGMSDAGSFLYAVQNQLGIINEAIIATWTISKNNILKLLDYLDTGKIQKLTFLINDGMLNTNSTKPIYAFMRLEFDKRKDKVIYNIANSHAKIQCYKCNENYYTISGSGNWSENPRIENYILIGGKETFEFNKNWITLKCYGK